ncbi:MAG: epoxide hydrolase [Steroidobacteraceae bacterium]
MLLNPTDFTSKPTAFEIRTPAEDIRDLHDRLARTRYAPDLGNEEWKYGVPTSVLKQWVPKWRQFDWRAAEQRLNSFDNYRVLVDQDPIHYVFKKGVGPNPLPLLLLHGWPWTYWDWHATVDRLADPAKYGGDAKDAFDVILPSLPGYTFSPLVRTGVSLHVIADVLARLMQVLGYSKFAVAGGDQGNFIAGQLGHKYADRLIGVQLLGAIPMHVFNHENPLAMPKDWGYERKNHHPRDPNLLTPTRLARHPTAHLHVNSIEPQTVSAAMHDSPVGLLSWMLDRRHWWSDNDGTGDVLQSFSEEFLLTTISLYWFTQSFATSVRTYYETAWKPWQPVHNLKPPVQAPTGIAFLDGDELTSHSRFWCEDFYNLKRTALVPRGGHFGAAEVPELVVAEIQQTMRLLRRAA